VSMPIRRAANLALTTPSAKPIMATNCRSDRNTVDQLLHKMVRAGDIARPARQLLAPCKSAEVIRSPSLDFHGKELT
jgi:hypothetical protein